VGKANIFIAYHLAILGPLGNTHFCCIQMCIEILKNYNIQVLILVLLGDSHVTLSNACTLFGPLFILVAISWKQKTKKIWGYPETDTLTCELVSLSSLILYLNVGYYHYIFTFLRGLKERKKNLNSIWFILSLVDLDEWVRWRWDRVTSSVKVSILYP
jgi:hypothetical protein